MGLSKDNSPKQIAARAILAFVSRDLELMPFDAHVTNRQRDLTGRQQERVRLRARRIVAPLRRRLHKILGIPAPEPEAKVVKRRKKTRVKSSKRARPSRRVKEVAAAGNL
jgi:hypothetical protein